MSNTTYMSGCRNGEVVEENSMYGVTADYEEYDQDNYDTRAVDNNDLYDSFRD